TGLTHLSILSQTTSTLAAYLNSTPARSIHVKSGNGGCCAAFASGVACGYDDGDFTDGSGMYWIRGVIIGEVVNAYTGTASGGWPTDWWVDSVWYFPGFTVVDVMKDIVPDHWMEWQTKEKYDQFGVSVLFDQLRQ